MSLYIPIRIVAYASGIDEQQIHRDIQNGNLRSDNGVVWYRDAAQYVYEKWRQGKVLMYEPYSDNVDQSFAMRVLSLMDDAIAAGNLTVKWTEKNQNQNKTKKEKE